LYKKIGNIDCVPCFITVMDGSMKRRILAAMMAVALTFSLMACQQTESSRLKKLTDSNWKVREQAALALGQSKSPQAVDRLISIFQDEFEVPYVRRAAALSLGRIGDTRGLEVLERYVMDQPTQWFIHWAAGDGLAEAGATSLDSILRCARKLLAEIDDIGYHDWHSEYKRILVSSLQRIGPSAFERLAQDMKSPDPQASRLAFKLLTWFDSPESQAFFARAIKDEDPSIRLAAIWNLFFIDESLWRKDISRIIKEDPTLRPFVLKWLDLLVKNWEFEPGEKQEFVVALTAVISEDGNREVLVDALKIINLIDSDSWARQMVGILNDEIELEIVTEILDNYYPTQFSDQETARQLAQALSNLIRRTGYSQELKGAWSVLFSADLKIWADEAIRALSILDRARRQEKGSFLNYLDEQLSDNNEKVRGRSELSPLKPALIELVRKEPDQENWREAFDALSCLDGEAALREGVQKILYGRLNYSNLSHTLWFINHALEEGLKIDNKDSGNFARRLVEIINGAEARLAKSKSPEQGRELLSPEVRNPGDAAPRRTLVVPFQSEEGKQEIIRFMAFCLLSKLNPDLFLDRLAPEEPQVILSLLAEKDLSPDLKKELSTRGITGGAVNYYLEKIKSSAGDQKEDLICLLDDLRYFVKANKEYEGEVRPLFLAAFQDKNCGVKKAALEAIKDYQDERVSTALIGELEELGKKYTAEIQSRLEAIKKAKNPSEEIVLSTGRSDEDCESILNDIIISLGNRKADSRAVELLINIADEFEQNLMELHRCYSGIVRNNQADKSSQKVIDYLDEEKRHLESKLIFVADALGKLKMPAAVEILGKLINYYYYSSLPNAAAEGLTAIDTQSSRQLLRQALNGPNPFGRIAAAYYLSREPDAKTEKILIKEAMKGNLEVAAGAFKFFLSNDAQRWESMLAEALNKYAQFLINQYITFSRRETGGEAINPKTLPPKVRDMYKRVYLLW